MRVLLPFVALISLVHAITIPDLLGREQSDTCASINTELVVPDPLGVLTAVGPIDTCLCLSSLPAFLETNIVAILGVTLAGERVVNNILTNLIYGAVPTGCHYPAHSIPACVGNNACGITCTDGFTLYQSKSRFDCVCEFPDQICNGVCASSCPSSVPSKRDVMSCQHGLTHCGTTGSKAYECVNTQTNLESCGGCSIRLDAYSPSGRDCSAIPGVVSVSCVNAGCMVHECMPGYTVSYHRSTCYNEDTFRLARDALRKYRIASGFI